jgi:magnesium chelatase subunit D
MPMTPSDVVYPFTALVGQDLLQRALLLHGVCPALGGVLIAGERGTAKSTAARALAAILPALAAVRGCPYHCEPGDPWPACPHCQGLAQHEELIIPAPFVELPLGATEDRVAGSLDMERTLREGRPVFRPGLLAAAHRGVLYIDEVNLLPDHLVDLLLDAAASGVHTVEREGIAVRHPARFVLVGTMNPEEGELRPQLADRFGLKVRILASTDPGERAEIVRRRLAFEADPVEFCIRYSEQQQRLREQLAAARTLYPSVVLTEEQVGRIAAVCCEQHVEGLRADLALARGARSLAALAGRTHVEVADLEAAAELVLPHRVRPPLTSPRPAPEQARTPYFPPREGEEICATGEPRGVSPGVDAAPPGLRLGARPGSSTAGLTPHRSPPDSSSSSEANGPPSGEEKVVPPGQAGPIPRMAVNRSRPAEAVDGGRRNPVPGHQRGRLVRAVPDPTASDVALDATLRAAALRGGEGQLTIRPEDLHRKMRQERTSSLVLFVVDASGSMGARRRMEAVKAAVLGLLADANRKRDEVAVISVRGPRAQVLLSPTRDVAVAERALSRLPTGGRTPLAHGLLLAREMVQDVRANGPVLLILVSDGKANVALPETDGDPWRQVLAGCPALVNSNVKTVVIDAEEGFVKTGRVGELAAALSAECVPLAAFSVEEIGAWYARPMSHTGGAP